MLNLTIRAPKQLYMGAGEFKRTGAAAAELGGKFAIVTGGRSLKASGRLDKLFDMLEENKVRFAHIATVKEEPDCNAIDAAVCVARDRGCTGVIGIGGGSAMDTAECVAGMLAGGGSIREYLPGVGNGRAVKGPLAKQILIPTTSGTGAEATHNAVVISRSEGWKKSFRAEYGMCDVAIVDPELIVSLPKAQTAYSGMDALAQLIEAYTTSVHNPYSDALALAGLKKVRALKDAYDDGGNMAARFDMAVAATFSGLAIANSGVTAAHALASGFGGALGISHGLACGILLPHIMQLNIDAERARFEDIAFALTGIRDAQAALDYVKELAAYMDVPPDFKKFDMLGRDIDRIMAGKSDSSLAKNPVRLEESEWRSFVRDIC